jgi:hypothetical protein
MIGKNRFECDVDREATDQQSQSINKPLAAMRVVFPGQRVLSEKVRPPDASLPTVENSRSPWPNDLSARTTSHGSTLRSLSLKPGATTPPEGVVLFPTSINVGARGFGTENGSKQKKKWMSVSSPVSSLCLRDVRFRRFR